MSPSDPWHDIEVPEKVETLNLKPVDTESRWRFYWGKRASGQLLLLLLHREIPRVKERIPKLRGVEVELAEYSRAENEHAVIIGLLDSSHKDLFCQLCIDVARTAESAESEVEAVRLVLLRLLRWHFLLKNGSDRLLSEEAQKGLIGELIVLCRVVIPELDAASAVRGWVGPTGAKQDFQIGPICIEVKTRKGSSEPSVIITSESQLDDSSLSQLYLQVIDLFRGAADQVDARSLTQYALWVREEVSPSGEAALELLEGRLLEAGFRWEDDYSDYLWIEGPHVAYRIANGFPRICASQLPVGISRVRYSVSLAACTAFELPDREIRMAIRGGIHE